MRAITLTCSPVVSGTSALLGYKKVLGIVQIGIGTHLNVVDDTRLQVDQKGSRNVMLVICLVEEYIFSILALSCVWLQNTVGGDSVLGAKLLPELVSDCKLKG